MSIVESIHSPIYVDNTGTRIDCMVKFDTVPVELPFTADANDVEEHGRAIHAALVAGEYGPIAAYVPPSAPPVIEQVGPNVVA
jgi:hypothetical protein